MSILNGGEQHLIMDMHDIRYMDSSGLGILAFAVKHLSPNAGTVNLVGCNATTVRALFITQMSAFVALHQNMDEAMEAIYAPVLIQAR